MIVTDIVVDRRAQMFPSLSAAQMERLAPLGRLRKAERGEICVQLVHRALAE
jgi:hypothetical protein